jgi:hypothetical protein
MIATLAKRPGVALDSIRVAFLYRKMEHACRLSFEGIVSKQQHPHRSGPSKSWLKVKNPTAPGVLRFQEEE